MKKLDVATRRGTVLNGALFLSPGRSDTLVIAITGIHGNFYSNPFYYDIGDALNAAGVDFAYAQTRNAFGVIRTRNAITENEEVIGGQSTSSRICHALLTYCSFIETQTAPGRSFYP